jgi:RimJ/RimL family protein N-acetyltransferase
LSLFEEQKSVWLGFHLLPEFQGKGLATEAAQAALIYAWNVLDLEEVNAGHHPEHLGSKNVLRKLGFVQYGTFLYPPTGRVHPIYRVAKPKDYEKK